MAIGFEHHPPLEFTWSEASHQLSVIKRLIPGIIRSGLAITPRMLLDRHVAASQRVLTTVFGYLVVGRSNWTQDDFIPKAWAYRCN